MQDLAGKLGSYSSETASAGRIGAARDAGFPDCAESGTCFFGAKLRHILLENNQLKQRYQGLFEEAPVGYIVCEPDGSILTANKTFCGMVGLSAEDPAPRKFSEFVLPESQEELSQMMRRVLNSRSPEPDAAEIHLRSDNGPVFTTVTSNLYMESFEDALWSGGPLIRSAVTDVTALKRKQLEILQKSLRDPLTGMYNRRFYNELLEELDRPDNLPFTVAMVDMDGLKLINDSLGHLFGDKAIITVARALQEFADPRYLLIRTGGDEIVALFPATEPETAAEYLELAEKKAAECLLAGISLTFSWGIATKRRDEETLHSTIESAEDRMYSRKLLRCAERKEETVLLVMRTLFESHPAIESHCRRVSERAAAFANYLGLNDAQVLQLHQAGLLHDIGLASIAGKGLENPVPWPHAQIREYRRHAEIGYRILHAAPGMSELAEAALYHHEQWDGGGFPSGIKGERIPFAARLICVVDACDHMEYGGSGQAVCLDAQISAALREGAGRKFDPLLAERYLTWRDAL